MASDSSSSASRTMLKGVISEGLRTTLFPAAMAGAIFQPAITSGRFHGATQFFEGSLFRGATLLFERGDFSGAALFFQRGGFRGAHG